MGRLKAWQNLNPLFSGKYKKLLEEYGTKDYSKLLLQESLQDFISYNCGHCGHIQKLQAEELNSIVGHAFRLAYAAHLQKTGSSVRDVIPSFSSTPSSSSAGTHHNHFSYNKSQSQSSPSKAKSSSRSHNNTHQVSPLRSTRQSCSRSVPSTSPKAYTPECCCSPPHTNHTLPHISTHTHIDQRPCSSACSSHLEREGVKESSSCCSSSRPNSRCCNSSRPNSRCSSSTATAAVSSHFSKAVGDTSSMRTPTPGNNLAHCGMVKPPSTLPGLHYSDHEKNNNNNFHSPDSDTSNSPTELNTTRRLGDKPPLIKNVNISLESNLRLEDELNSVLSCAPNYPLNVTSQNLTNNSGHASIVGYVNENRSNESYPNNETCSSEDKCRFQDDLNLKRISQISMNSSVTSGNVTLDISSSSNFSNTPPPLPERSDSLTPPEEPHLKTAAWFQAGIPREIALEVLSREPVGAFMVRESTSKPGCYALSLRVPRDFTVSGIAHYLIVKTTKGYKIKGFTKEFVTLTALITHHSVMPELLPCPLSLSRYNPTFTTDDNRNDDDDNNSEDDPDYNTLSDFRKMMADLNV